jgi:hypothetical protein
MALERDEPDDEPRARGGDRSQEAADRRSPGQVEPEQIEVRPDGALTTINTIAGTAAASAYLAQGRDLVRSLAVTIPAASKPTANRTANVNV